MLKKLTDIKKDTVLRLLFLSALFVWCELVLHVADSAALQYAVIYILFGISEGFVFNLIPALLQGRAQRIAALVLEILVPLL